MEFNKLNERVLAWAESKGILKKATSVSQIGKTIEEVEETRDALMARENSLDWYVNSKGEVKNVQDEIIDGFGDVMVTILIGCKLRGINPLEALETALEVIEKRNGKMINGVFVKDK